MRASLRARKSATVTVLAGVVVGMGALAYAAVPLYQLFCQVTGYGGTTGVAAVAPGAASERVITVRFNADIAPDLAWTFRPAQREVRVRVGEEALAFYSAENTSGEALTGSAVFNVTPFKAGAYFNKIDCFCFSEQTLAPGARAEMGVSFFIDPALLEDHNLSEVNTITLSYTFFRAADAAAGQAAAAPERRGPAAAGADPS